MQAFSVLFIDHRYAKALLAVGLLKTLPFLSTPHVNNATFQRINFVKLKFIWISLNIFKKNKYVIEINIGAYLLFLSIPKEQYFLYWSQRIAAWLSTSFTLKFVNFFT